VGGICKQINLLVHTHTYTLYIYIYIYIYVCVCTLLSEDQDILASSYDVKYSMYRNIFRDLNEISVPIICKEFVEERISVINFFR
jgi:Na+-translocating ferredoxin:NAD+ oxidoreductase RnfE subunit